MKKSTLLSCSVIAIIILIVVIMFSDIHNFKIVEKHNASDNNNKLLLLVNDKNPVPDDYTPELIILSNGVYIDKKIYPDLQEMFDTMRENGIYPTVVEGYRTSDKQHQMMQEYIDDYISQGYSEKDAAELALQWVAKPNHSEHETGLAVDINADTEYGTSDDDVYSWLKDNAHKYGFILRYPQNTEDITGIEYEPWHYRYVGKKDASAIYSKGITLEEYLE